MGFEAPLALLGLLATAVPVVAHLVRRKDLPVRPLPTLVLLQRARARSRRRMRLVDLLLLACRVLLLAILALAIADPYLEGSLAFSDGARGAVAIVLDDSMSMARREGGARLSERARARADGLLAALPEGSEATVVLAGAPARVLVPLTDDLEGARARLAEAAPASHRGTDLPGGVARALRQLAGAREAGLRLVVLTDLARHASLEEIEWPDGEVAYAVERIGRAPGPNRAVVAARAVPDPTRPGTASVAVELATRGDDAPFDVELVRGGAVVARGRVEPTRGAGRLTLHGPLVREGDASALVRIAERDVLDADDARAVLLRAPSSLRLLLVDGDPQPTRDRGELGYLSRALDAAPQGAGGLTYRTVDADALESVDPSGTDVIVLANAGDLSASGAARLRELVAAGAGLLVTVGDRVAPRALEARLGELLPTRLRARGRLPAPLGLVVAPGSALFDPAEAGLDGATVSERILLEQPPAGGRTELAFEDGAPALVTGRHGAGRTAVLATSIDDAWTDLPLRPGFVPLVVGLARGLAPREAAPDEAVLAGTPVTLRVPAGATRLEVIDPGGAVIVHEGEAPLTLDETGLAGAYRVRVSRDASAPIEDPRLAFVVAPPASESDLEVGEAPPARQAAQAEAGTARVRRPLAPLLFGLFGLLVVAEALLRTGLRRRRAAPTPA